ncbi:MAG: hypothetical protein HY512_01795 [Candidatus Aenigmarchaeota archaeon]|nr:hypothetical protein [Candidatus Aenigmarchaeota archaeon]
MVRYCVRDIEYTGNVPLSSRDGSEQRRKVEITNFKPYNSVKGGVNEEGILLTLASGLGDSSKVALIGDDVDRFLGDMCVERPAETVGRKIRAFFVQDSGRYFVVGVSTPKQKIGDAC